MRVTYLSIGLDHTFTMARVDFVTTECTQFDPN